MSGEQEEVQTPSAVEVEARSLGWVPQEDFRGDSSRWVDAETFVERGHTVMPILKKTNERLEGTVKKQAEEIARLDGLFKASQEAIEELRSYQSAATKAAVEKARKDLLAELRVAKEEGNIEREVEITDALADIKAEQQAAAKAISKVTEPEPPKVDPALAAWQAENSWFGVDQRKTLRAMGIAQELRADPEYDSLQGRPFYDKVMEVMAERTGGPRTSKVAEPRGGSGGGSPGKRTFADLPPEAKAACERQAAKLVGEGRAFKDKASWQAHYTTIYFAGEQS